MKLFVFGMAVLLIGAGSAFAAEDLDSAFQDFKQAETQKDVAQLKTLAVSTHNLARQVAATPAPAAEADKQAWTEAVEHGRTVGLYVEYALLVAALRGPAADTVDLFATLEQVNPKSKYLDQAYPAYFEALRQTGAGAKIPAIAAKAAANLPDNLDLLIWLVDSALSRKANARDLGYAKRLIAVLSKNAKPESLSAADWERKRTTALGRAYTLAGCVQTDLGQYPDGDKSLRAALPLVSGNEALKAQVLYYLGVANFQFGTMTMNKALVVQAAKFSEQAADIPGPLRDAAYHNAQVMRQRATQMH
jgi:hypothetical protein